MKLKKLLVLLLLLGAALILSACTPEPGDKGARGPQGDKGLTGETGDAGDKGATGQTGIAGIDGLDGHYIEFAFDQDGLCWRYYTEDDSDEWRKGPSFEEIFEELTEAEQPSPVPQD